MGRAEQSRTNERRWERDPLGKTTQKRVDEAEIRDVMGPGRGGWLRGLLPVITRYIHNYHHHSMFPIPYSCGASSRTYVGRYSRVSCSTEHAYLTFLAPFPCVVVVVAATGCVRS